MPAPVGARAVLVDGMPAEHVPVSDRGLAYGDGLFETIRIAGAGLCLWDAHVARLSDGCRRLGIPPQSAALLESEARSLAAGCDAGVLKLILTRGSGGRGYRPDPDASARRIWMRFDPPGYPPDWQINGVAVRFCQAQASYNPALAGLKHLNRLDNVLARSEWSDPEIAEGLMQGPRGELVGGTQSNIFLWDGQALATPLIHGCGVAGTMRAAVMRIAQRHGIRCAERVICRDELVRAHGAFLTSALIGVWPIRRVESTGLDPRRLPRELLADLILASQTEESPQW